MISCIDHNVGRILDHLDHRGIADNTMVVFFSDHGDMLGEHGYFCGIKPQGQRSAMHVPFIARYPNRFEGGTRVNDMIDVGIDTPVTLLDLAGAEPLSKADGRSYLPLLDGEAGGREEIMYQTFRMDDGAKGEFTPVPERGIRTSEWLYVRQPDRRKLLFDQKKDPHELNNLVENADYNELMDEFDAKIDAHMKATGDDWNLHADFPPPDFLTHEAAKDFLVNELLPRAIEVP